MQPNVESPSRFAAAGAPDDRPEDVGGQGARVSKASAGRVLIVEDNWLVALEMEAALLDANYAVLGIAVSSAEAVAACERERPDFVLMDIRLHGRTDGVDAAVMIRERFDIPSIFVSAHDDAETRSRAEAAKPLGWIVKPFPSTELIKRIESFRRAAK